MNRRFILTFVSLVLVIFFCFRGTAYCAEQTPEKLVRDFYKWYIAELLRDKRRASPDFDDTMYKYVYPCTVKRLRIDFERGAFDEIYFTKRQDHWPELLAGMTVGKAVKINNTISIVPVSISTKKDSKPELLVFVQKEKGSLYITKVESIYYYEEKE